MMLCIFVIYIQFAFFSFGTNPRRKKLFHSFHFRRILIFLTFNVKTHLFFNSIINIRNSIIIIFQRTFTTLLYRCSNLLSFCIDTIIKLALVLLYRFFCFTVSQCISSNIYFMLNIFLRSKRIIISFYSVSQFRLCINKNFIRLI